MNTFLKLFLPASVLAVAFIACDPVNPVDTGQSQTSTQVLSDETVILGKRLENPYTVENMLRAQANLAKTSTLQSDITIGTTHLYLRFLPRDSADMAVLYFDNDLILFDTPLDYEILTEGSVYRDSDIPADQPRAQYTAVQVDKALPDVPYEILAELFLPNENDSELAKTQDKQYGRLLENEALRITGNAPQYAGLAKTAGFNPSGCIKVHDEVLNTDVPMGGVNVRARNWFKLRSGYTASDGTFRLGDFIGDNVGFSIKWEYKDEKFDIRDGALGQAFYNGPNKARTWNPIFTQSTSQNAWFYSHIYRAGDFYISREPFGLNNTPFKRISIQAMDGNCPVDMDAYYKGTNENIRIWKKRNDGTKNSSVNLFANASHELGHAHHDEIYDGSFVANVDDRKLKESWAVAIEFYMTSTVYGANAWGQINGSPFDVARQSWSSDCSFPNYTPLMVDLIDTHNQRTARGVSTYLDDRVSGYTLKQFETIIAKNGCKKLSDFISEIKNLPLPAGITATTRDNYLNQF